MKESSKIKLRNSAKRLAMIVLVVTLSVFFLVKLGTIAYASMVDAYPGGGGGGSGTTATTTRRTTTTTRRTTTTTRRTTTTTRRTTTTTKKTTTPQGVTGGSPSVNGCLSHAYNWTTISAANCTSAEVRRGVCGICGKTTITTFGSKDPNNHVSGATTSGCTTTWPCCEKTSTSHSYSAPCDTTCNRCGRVRSASPHTPANGGTANVHTKCAMCGVTISWTHSYTTTVTKAATCSATGIKTLSCACGYSKTETIAKTAHTPKTANIAATCTTNGWIGRKVCSVCGTVTTKGSLAAAKGHSWGSWSTTTAATCTSAGSQSRSCSVCNATDSATIPATGHNYVSSGNSAATCTSSGISGKTVCSSCGAVGSSGTVIPPLGHSYSWSGCKGTCTRCGASTTVHSYSASGTVAATCTAQGYDLYVCSDCGASYKTNYKAKLSHRYTVAGNYVTVPTCTASGTRTYSCSYGCGNTTTKTVAATGHSPNADDGDCTTAITCKTCGTITTAAKTHTFTDAADTTCNNSGCTYTRVVAFYLDVNGLLDGSSTGDTSGYGTFDVYVNGTQVANDVSDYYTAWNTGSTYEIKDIKATVGHTYVGVSSGSISGTIGTANLSVQLKFITNTYTVTWKNHDGTVLETDTGVAYGTTPTYNGSTPTKASTAQYSYSFTGWSPTVSSVTGNVTYTAQFKATTRTYTVTWKNHDGTVLETDTGVAYGTTPTYNGSTPTKASTAQYSYSFTGWSPTVYSVTGNVTYTAQFKATTRTYTVTWMNYDGTVLETDTDVAYGTTPTYNGSTPTRAATKQYTFAFGGWTPSISTVTGNITYTATFTQTLQEYTIVYNSNGGTGGTVSQHTVKYGDTVTIKANAFTRKGYSFVGWSTKTDNTNDGYNWTGWTGSWAYGNGEYGITNNTLTLYARWVANTYTITWDASTNGGKVNGVNSVTTSQTYDANVGLPSYTPTKTGYTFKGWYTAATGGTKITASTKFQNAGDITYYAQFTANTYTITWDASTNGGKVNGANSVTTSQTYDANVGLPSYTPTKTGYTFKGWYTAATGGTKITASTKFQNAGDITYYAQFTANTYTVVYNGNGNTGGSTASSTHTYDVAKNLTTNGFTRTGYTFAGWAETPNGVVKYSDQAPVKNLSYTDGAVVNLYAVWTPVSYKITYNENGGSAVADLNYTIETDITLATAPTREGYIFLGWNLASSAGNWNRGLYEAGDNIGTGKYGTIELVAQWRAITYQVKYNANGGAGVMANSNHVYDVAKNLSKNIFTREGYTFVGWATSANGGKVYSDEQAVLNIVTSDGAVVELYAVWTPWSYTVIYHGNGSTSGSTPNSTHYRDQAQMLNANGFAKQYTVSFNANGGTCATNSLTAKYNFYGWALTATGAKVYDDQQSVVNLTTVPGSTVNLYAVWTGGTITLPTPTRTGYIFAGWALSVGDTSVVGEGGDTYTAKADVTLYALWTPITYYVRYNANGGVGSMGISTFEYGRTYNLAKNTFTRAGYTFKGWATSANGDKVYNDRQAVSNLATAQGAIVDLYAVWEGNAYSIVYDLVGGTAGANAPTEATYDVGFNVSAPTRSGYIFLGWKVTGMDNTTHFYGAGSTNYSQTTENTISRTTAVWFKNLTAVADGTVQFTAVWASTDIELTAITLKYYDSNGNLRTITDLNNVPLVSRVYVYHTYTNNSDLTQTVNGYHNGSSGMITYSGTTDFTLASGASVQVLAGNFVPALGEHTITGYVYLDGKPFGDTSAENDGTNNRKSLTYRVAFDVELVEIYFTDVNGNRLDSDNVLVGVQVQVHHVYRNNSAGAISVDIYHNGVKYGSIASMGANSTQDVVAATFTPSAAGTYSVSGAIYRSGMNASTETCETNLANNSELLIYEAVNGPGIDIFDPGVDLRMGTDVFTSFTITNDNDTNFTPDNPLMVTVTITAADGTLVKKMTQEAIVPAREEQLVWFRWTVPFKEGPYTIEATIEMADPDSGNGEGYTVVVDEFSYTCDVISSEDVFPPETSYEDSRPSDWAQPAKPSTVKDSAEWTVWEYDYEKKEFKQVTYGISVSPGTAVITPDSPTAYKDGGQWYMKAGYGFFISASNAHINGAAGCTMPSSRDYTTSQWAYVLFPEFKYMTKQSGVNYMATMECINGEWVFADHDDYGRKHFTPVWYPDTTVPANAYFVRLVQSEIWTPVGVLTVYGPSTGIYISGDIYDDWYTG